MHRSALKCSATARSLEKDETVRWLAGAVTPLYLLAAQRALRRTLAAAQREGKPFDVVHAHWIVPNGIPAAAAGLGKQRRASAPLFAVGLHGSDVFMAEKPLVALTRRALPEALGTTHRLFAGAG